MSLKISVIIPVYNAEKYLEACIESLLNQTLKECEFIFVNDGSTDRSREIIEHKLKISKQIKLINQKNNGVSSARNSGLRIASGEYVGFVDADDTVDETYFFTLYKAIEESNCDVVISRFSSNKNERNEQVVELFPLEKQLNKDFIKDHILPYFIKSDSLNSVVNKLYKTQLILNNNIQFPINIALGEDGSFNLHYFYAASSAIFLQYCGYYYREVEGSATRNIETNDYFQRVLDVYTDRTAEYFLPHLQKERIGVLKSIKFINNVVSLTYLYLSNNNKRSFKKRYYFVKKMITNAHTKEALGIFISQKKNEISRYEKFILKMIEKQSVLGIYCAVNYSKFRNK